MGSVIPIVRSVLAVPGLVLRRDWLRIQIRERSLESMANELNALCESAEACDESSREALVAWVAVLVSDGESPWVADLRRCSHEARYYSLMRLLRSYSAPSSLDVDKDDAPNHDLGRQMTVGERRSLARRAQRAKLARLLRDPNPMVLRQLLINPKLTENDVITLAAHRPARASTLRTLAEFPDWIVRARVRMTIVFNPATPSSIAVPLAALSMRPELVQIAESPSLHVVLRVIAQELLERHPPLGPADTLTLH